mmetsp:Transcript_86405/g.135204  ORF Transcript_86405/g.135204 Transcript_86405/m.135204 type:complete len:153 (-) Transcript_86405:49-507(-)
MPCSGEKVRSQFVKTCLCKFHAEGRCLKGEECQFAHTTRELREAPNLTKTSLCMGWKNGTCKLSIEECHYAHGWGDLRQTFERRSPVAYSNGKCPIATLLAVLNIPQGEEVSLFGMVAALKGFDGSYVFEDPVVLQVLCDKLLGAVPSHYED